MIDLHTHSKASDGSLSPEELATYAAGKGLDVWALTDHDTTSGLQEAAVAAAKHHIQFIPGIELNIDWYSGEFHLLGLGLTTVSAELAETTEMLRTSRNDRNIENTAAILKQVSPNLIVTTLPDNIRSIHECNSKDVTFIPSPIDAFQYAQNNFKGTILITGSFYLCAYIKEYINGSRDEV